MTAGFPDPAARDDDLAAKRQRAEEVLRGSRSVIVALSGGVDSAVLLGLAVEALGAKRVLAVTGRSPSLPAHEGRDASRIAARLGVRHEFVDTRELERPGYRANAGDRCYHCRVELFDVLAGLARRRGFEAVAYGAIRDDERDYRPGMAAARERAVLAPLQQARLSKHEVRRLAADLGLHVRDKPAGACLSSRIPAGTQVTPERLARIDRAEQHLRGLGFRQLRVRDHGEMARIELDEEGRERCLADPALCQRVVEAVRAAGFHRAMLDPQGYRTGSLNPAGAARGLYRIRPTRDGGQ